MSPMFWDLLDQIPFGFFFFFGKNLVWMLDFVTDSFVVVQLN